MRRILLFILCITAFLISRAQVNPATRINTGNTYAVIIGISSYGSNGITRLDYAHRDAEEFDRFLRTRAGGNVPEGNIRLLLNEKATYTAIYNALYWLLDTCKKDDVVYFYFSGHGDVENNTIYKLGFLLAANTPRFNYINNAIRVEDVNNIANTISVEKKARVIVITDACRSGKLAGNENRGNFLVGEQLRAARGNEIRMTSCGPDELSNEDAGWAGGRGVFSYYLVRGLEGLADISGDKIVTLDEIRSYLQKSLAADPLLSRKENRQHPVVNGAGAIPISVVDSQALREQGAVQSNAPNTIILLAPPAPLGKSVLESLLEQINYLPLEDQADFNQLAELPAAEIPFAFLQMIKAQFSPTDSISQEKLRSLERSIRSNPASLRRFTDKLVELMADRGQAIINLYLEGDEAELEKRRYYNSVSNSYEVYVKMFATAMKLVPPQSELYHILQVKYYYFSGIVKRIRILLVNNPIPVLDSAMKLMQAAYKLQDDAAYIHNELGNLFLYQNNTAKSEEHYLMATLIAPSWAIPWTNLANLYIARGHYDKATDALNNASRLQPDFQGILMSRGLLNEKKGNLLFAEEYFRKSIRVNTRHYLPFERMGYLCLATTRYAEADSNFLEADKRKRGYNVDAFPAVLGTVENLVLPPMPDRPCRFDTSLVKPNDVIGNFYLGLYYLDEQKPDKAEVKFRQVIRIDPANPLVFHTYGKLLFEQGRWKQTDLILKYAVDYFRDSASFSHYCDSLIRLFPKYGKEYSCVMDRFRAAWVPKRESRYYLGTAYEKWNHFEEAENQFRTLIREEPDQKGAYYKLWNLLENTGRYYDAESVISSFPDPESLSGNLFAFYHRVSQRHPERGEWYYKAGALMYDNYRTHPDFYLIDHKHFKPDAREPGYASGIIYKEQGHHDEAIPGTNEQYSLFESVKFPLTEAINDLAKADSLVAATEWLAEINFKLGDCYVWQGLPQLADVFYKKSIHLKPEDVNTRIKFIQTSIVNYNYETALGQLDTLYASGGINYPNQVLLAKYRIHAGRFDEVMPLLKEAAFIHPYQQDELMDLEGRLALLSGKTGQALSVYNQYLNNRPGDFGTMYTLARIYAGTNNRPQALKWLGNAVSNGFDFYWVLKYDQGWNDYRKDPKWISITRNIRSKE